ncbi:RE2 [Symbiodinium necroappetens]|uniref:RE2 protein n=1 Tax=Symbiodinium necroappetens TaxID=1628268 RepID=A0A812UA68_9DINO|nr:RE2 [Symbiodinium necroappetens]
MAAGTLLDSLRFARFIHDQDEAGGAATESRYGIPRYNGDASRLTEWVFRVKMLAEKEKSISEAEAKKLGSLPLRLVEGLSGQALKIAQQLDVSKLAAEGGVDYLIEKMSTELRPRRMQQARELYEAGAQQGGILSRQASESMAQYILRRRAWYRAMTDLSTDLKLPDLVLSEQLLLNAGLNDDQRLMIRTVVGDKMNFDRVAEELVNQHPRIHEKGAYHPFRKNEYKGFPSSSPSSKGGPKGYRPKPRYYNAFHAESVEDEAAYPEMNDEVYGDDGPDYLNEETGRSDYENPVYFSEAEIGTYAEEHLAYLSESGLDIEDQEACEFASELIQSEQDAYYARKGASHKGHGGFNKASPPPFEISGSISLDDKRARLRALKARTTCKRCGAVGHWSGDYECPLSKGKGKKGGGKTSTSTPSSSGAGTSQHPGAKGRHGKPSRPRTVYFSISEATSSTASKRRLVGYAIDEGGATAHLTPGKQQLYDFADEDNARGNRRQLECGYFPDDRGDVVGRTLWYQNLECSTRMPWRRLQLYLFMIEYDQNRPQRQQQYLFLIESDHSRPQRRQQYLFPIEYHQHVPKKVQSASLQDRPRRPQRPHPLLHRIPQDPLKDEENASTYEPQLMDPTALFTKSNARIAGTSSPAHDEISQLRLRQEPPRQRPRANTTGPPGEAPMDPCAFGLAEIVDIESDQPPRHDLHDENSVLTIDRIPGVLQTFQDLVVRRVQELESGTEVPTRRLHEALDLSIATATTWNSRMSGPAGSSTTVFGTSSTTRPHGGGRRYGESDHYHNLKARGLKVVEMGRYKHGQYAEAYADTAYRKWVLDNIGPTSASGMKAMRNYFEERQNYESRPDAMALMAIHDHSDHIEEHDLIAILDTGCNQTCHGDRWLERYVKATKQQLPEADTTSEVRIRGIGGQIRTSGTRKLPLILELVNGGLAQGDLTSTELLDSDAPLLISMQAQRALGLIIDIAGEVVHSQTLGHDLKLAYKEPETAPRDDHPGEESAGDDEELIPAMPADGKGDDAEKEVAYYTFDAEKARVMNKTQHFRVKEGVDGVKSKDRHMWNQIKPSRQRRHHELPRGCKTFLLEVFAGAAMLTQMALHEWSMPVTPPVDLNTGYDLLTKQGRDEVDRIIARDDPFAITFAPVCTPWTSWTNIATGTTRSKIMAERKKWQPALAWMYDVAKDRLSKGRHVVIENPWNSAMWDCVQSQRFFRANPRDEATLEPMECVKVDQCMLSLKDDINHLPHLKPTGFLTASSEVKRRLVGAHCDGSHLHQQLDTKKRCMAAQKWPRDLCKALLQGLAAELDYLITMVAFPAEAHTELEVMSDDEGEENTYLDGIHQPSDFAYDDGQDYAATKKQEEWEIIYDEGEVPPPPQPVGDALERRQHQWRQLPYNTRVALRRLHNMTGHAPPSAMQRLLRTAGADANAIKALDSFRCATCEAKKVPDRPSPVKMPEEYRFNKAVSLDVFIVKDTLNKKYKVMSVVDLGTLFHAAVIVGEGGGPPSSGDMAKAMQMIWFSWAGPPESIVLDRGLENRGQLQKLMTAHGVQLRYIGVESPWQLGRGERHGGLLKEVIKAVVTSRQLRGRQNMEFVVTESVGIKNHRVNHNGFSPSQWVLGRNPPDLESLTTLLPEAKLGVHQEILDGETSFAQQMMIRGAAKEAFSRVDSSQRIRAAMLRKSVPGRGPFHMGDLVCFHRRQGSKAGWKWFGPARVIGQEGRSTLWVCHGGIPMTVSTEQCRHATGTEMMAKRMLELRPSRKRRREDMAPDVDDAGAMNDDPFLDDLIGVGTVAENQQQGFFDLSDASGTPTPAPDEPEGPNGQEIPGLHPPPPGLSPLEPGQASQLDDNGQEIPGLQAPPPGLSPDVNQVQQPHLGGPVHVQQPHLGGPVQDMPDVPDSDVGSPSMSTAEPEQELVPPSRDISGQPDLLPPSSSTANRSSTSRAPEPLRPLQQALRISPDALDGHPRNRHRSRSPPRAMMTIGENPEVGKCLHGFLARRLNKKSAAARAKELNFTKATGEERDGIQEARKREWGNWQGFDAVEVIPPEKVQETLAANPEAEITPTRWVDINKAQPWLPPKYKSRIVVRGDLESGASTRTDSPTCSATMLGLLLSFTANRRLQLRGGDITASFLQGEKLVRVLLLKPPPGGLPGVPEGSLLRALKPVYGTRDAPRGFFKRLHNVAVAQGLRALPHEHAAYVLQDETGVQGMMVAHVDDLLWSGTGKMDKVMDAITKEFKFGTLEFGSQFDYCGRTIAQETEGIRVTCPNHASKVRPIPLEVWRRRQKDAKITEPEREQLRSVVGSLSWMVRVCRLDIAYEVNYLQAVMQQAVVADLIACNNLLSYVKKTADRGLFYAYNAFDEQDQVIYSITDASHAADFDVSTTGTPMGSRSQSGRILALGSRKILETGKGTIHIIEYHSCVLKRVCRSTLQAETQSLIAGYEEGEHLRALMWGMNNDYHDKGLIGAMDHMTLAMLTDCRSLEQHLRQPGLSTVADKRLAIDLSSMRQLIWRKKGELVGDPLLTDEPPEEATTVVKWIDTSTMLSDGLTKKMKSNQIDQVMLKGTMEISFQKVLSKPAEAKEKLGV